MGNCLLPLFLLLPAAVNAQQSAGLHCSCQQQHSRIELSVMESRPESTAGTGRTEWIDPSSLVQYGTIEGSDEVRRTGSTSITRKCGELSLTVRGGLYNANLQGELGAMEDYAIVEVLDSMGNTTGPMAMGSCDTSSPRQNYMVDCPQDWIVNATAVSTGKGMRVHVNHQYEDYRQPMKSITPPQAH